MITVRLFGPMAIIDAAGRNITPRGAKAQALVALVLATPDYMRSRVWLQDKLWSARAPGQAAGSLRQALLELRKALGDHGDVIAANRQTISLRPAQIMVKPRVAGQEYLEGIDVGDPEFEDWLTVQRSQDGTNATILSGSDPVAAAVLAITRCSEPLRVAVVVAKGIPQTDRLLVDMIADVFVQGLEERAVAEVQLSDEDAQADVLIDLQFHPGPRILRAHMQTRIGARHVWAQTLSLQGVAADGVQSESIALFVTAGIEAVVAAALRQDHRAAVQGHFGIHQAVRRIFGFQAKDLILADTQLSVLGQEHPAALGWRIFLKMVQRVECAVPATAAFAEQVEDLMQEALRRDPNNTIVLSAAAHACIKVLDRPDDALILAQRALRQSWSNPFALDVVADALLLQGRAADAYPIAKRAQFVGQSTPMSHFFDMGLALACVAMGRTDDALALAQQAIALAPSFRPALRYAVILNANMGRPAEALRALGRLRAIEPTFDLGQIVEDPDYPVATIRKAGLAGKRIVKLLQ